MKTFFNYLELSRSDFKSFEEFVILKNKLVFPKYLYFFETRKIIKKSLIDELLRMVDYEQNQKYKQAIIYLLIVANQQIRRIRSEENIGELLILRNKLFELSIHPIDDYIEVMDLADPEKEEYKYQYQKLCQKYNLLTSEKNFLVSALEKKLHEANQRCIEVEEVKEAKKSIQSIIDKCKYCESQNELLKKYQVKIEKQQEKITLMSQEIDKLDEELELKEQQLKFGGEQEEAIKQKKEKIREKISKYSELFSELKTINESNLDFKKVNTFFTFNVCNNLKQFINKVTKLNFDSLLNFHQSVYLDLSKEATNQLLKLVSKVCSRFGGKVIIWLRNEIAKRFSSNDTGYIYIKKSRIVQFYYTYVNPTKEKHETFRNFCKNNPNERRQMYPKAYKYLDLDIHAKTQLYSRDKNALQKQFSPIRKLFYEKPKSSKGSTGDDGFLF